MEVELPLFEELTTACVVTMVTDAFAFHRNWMTERWTDYGGSMRASVGIGATFTAADYAQAQKVRRIGANRLAALLEDVDLLAVPTVAIGAPTLDGLTRETMPVQMLYTLYWNAVGCPTIAVPMGLGDAGLPLSLSIAGKPFADDMVLKAADAFQRQTTHHLLAPPTVASVSAKPEG